MMRIMNVLQFIKLSPVDVMRLSLSLGAGGPREEAPSQSLSTMIRPIVFFSRHFVTFLNSYTKKSSTLTTFDFLMI